MPSESPMAASSKPLIQIISKSTIFPATKSAMPDLKLSVSDLPMLSCHYIQKGNLFTRPQIPSPDLLFLLRRSLSRVLTAFPPLAGRLTTDSDGYVYITCNDSGVEFVHANASHLSIHEIVSPVHVPDSVKGFFTFDRTVSYEGHCKPILGVQVTELEDGVFIGFSVNHAIVDGTSLWNFINAFAEVCRGESLNLNLNLNSNYGLKSVKSPSFVRDSVLISSARLKIPDGGIKVTFDEHAPLRERIFSFNKASISKLKNRVNHRKKMNFCCDDEINVLKLLQNELNGRIDDKVTALIDDLLHNLKTSPEQPPEVSSFQTLCALLWRAVTRARKFPNSKTTTFRMAVNCRHRLKPELETFYFGNAIQSIPTYATAGDVLSNDLKWCAEQLNKSVSSHDNTMVNRFVKNWENDPRCFPLGNFDGAMLTMGSSPRFPMFDNDFGWGKPVAVRSGRANKFDGKISAFPGRDGGGSVDLEVVLSPETMAGIESDPEFMQYVSGGY